MRVKEGVMMNKKDWFYSGIIAISLLLLIISNIELIILMLSRSYVWALFYGLGIAILLFILTKLCLTRWGIPSIRIIIGLKTISSFGS